MKARGKFERASSAKRGKLLRVYATSLLSLLLCCTMFVGTTMAWFTDSVSSSSSQITAGELKLEVKYGGDNGTAVETLSENSVLFEDVVWKPGHEETETLAVQNKGNLPFRYILKLEVKEDDCKDAEDKVLDKAARNALMEQYTVYLGEIGAASNKIGTLKDIIANKTELVDAVLEAPVAPEETNGKTYELKLVMDETAEIEFMGQSLGLVLKVDAYQEDTPDYEIEDMEEEEVIPPSDVLQIGTKEQLLAFAADVNTNGNSYSGKKVVLTADIDLGNQEWTPIGQTNGHYAATYFKGIFDGQGHTISNLSITTTSESGTYAAGFFGFIDTADATIKNLKINGAVVNGHHWTGVVAGYLTGQITNCTVTNATITCTHANNDACGDKAGVITGYINGGFVKDNTVSNCTVTAGRDAGQVVGASKADRVSGNTVTNVTVTAAGDCTGANIRNEVIGRIL